MSHDLATMSIKLRDLGDKKQSAPPPPFHPKIADFGHSPPMQRQSRINKTNAIV